MAKIKRDAATCKKLAREFARVLRSWLSDEEMREVIKRNNAQVNPSICHSHDFCDANMAMHEAQENLKLNLDIGGDSPESERDCQFWGQAWNFALKNRFWF